MQTMILALCYLCKSASTQVRVILLMHVVVCVRAYVCVVCVCVCVFYMCCVVSVVDLFSICFCLTVCVYPSLTDVTHRPFAGRPDRQCRHKPFLLRCMG